MTPYAVLFVKPTDTDEIIRKAYHLISSTQHPDAVGNAGRPGPEWYTATEAYTSIKTLEARQAWELRQRLLANKCFDCEGSGVRGTRMFKGKIKICGECKGEGRCR